MSKEKALEYLKLTNFKESMFDLLVKSYSSMIKEVPPSVWTEVFMDLDYEPTEDITADLLAEIFDDDEFDVIIDFAKQPVFGKFVAMQADTDIEKLGRAWYDANHKAILEKIQRIFPARGVPQNITDTLVETFAEEL
jgi:hypothetical protein